MTYTNTMRWKASKAETSSLSGSVTDIQADITTLEADILALEGVVTQEVETTILTADVLTLNATPIELVPAPGAGKAIVVERVLATVDYNSAAYATNTTIEVRYTDGSGTKVTADIAGLLTATADKYVSVGGIEAELVLTANAPVVARVATGDPTAGDSPIKLKVIYRVVEL